MLSRQSGLEIPGIGVLMVRVLLVEDDPLISKVLVYYMEQEETYTVTCAETAGEALARARDKFDIILMDILLPDANGIELCERLRQWHDCPIIFISCLDDSNTIVNALSSGGDAFITKPFDNKVLIACMEANLRRYAAQPPAQIKNTIEGGGLVLDANRHVVIKNDREIKLSDTEFRLLSFLMLNAGRNLPPRSYTSVCGEVAATGTHGPCLSIFIICDISWKRTPRIPDTSLWNGERGIRFPSVRALVALNSITPMPADRCSTGSRGK